MLLRLYIILFILYYSAGTGFCQNGFVRSVQKISNFHGNFIDTLPQYGIFGVSNAAIGDIDGDSINDIAVGTIDNDGGMSCGSVWILFLDTNGTVKNFQKISATHGGFTGDIEEGDYFGYAITSLGDLDGDTVTDIAVCARNDDDGDTTDMGAVWILFLNTDGTVKGHQKISSTQGGFTGDLDHADYFGSSVSAIGDLDGDSITEIAVGAMWDDDGGSDEGSDRGALWIIFLNSDGTVKDHQKISDTQGNFTGGMMDDLWFGYSVTAMDDIDGDQVPDIAVGSTLDNDGGDNRGAVWILFLNSDGTVKSYSKVSDTQGDFTGILDDYDLFGASVCSMDDLDGDSVRELAVGANRDDDGGIFSNTGAVWILFPDTAGKIKGHQKISRTQGGFSDSLDNNDNLGVSVSCVGDLDGDGYNEIVAGANGDDDGGNSCGAIWILFTGEIPDRDIGVLYLDILPALALYDAPYEIKGTLKNFGITTITSFNLNYSINGNAPVTETITDVELLMGDVFSYNHTVEWNPAEEGVFSVCVWASALNGDTDQNNINDTVCENVEVIENCVQRIPLYEVFTSSTCNPCLEGNYIIDSILNDNPDKYTAVKYQMNWPSPGDLYYTDEGGERRAFYGVTGIPVLYVDGDVENIIEYSQGFFNDHYLIPSQIIIDAEHIITGQTVDVHAGITAMKNYFDNNIFAFIAVVEDTTYNNTGTNGETEFHWVMKKMLPDAEGTQVGPLMNDLEVIIDETYTFTTGHTVEEFDDLSVVVFVQNIATGEVYQSAWSERLDNINHTDKIRSISIFPNPAADRLFIRILPGTTGDVSVELSDITGKTILNEEYNNVNDIVTVNIANNPAGIYFVRVITKGGIYISKFVICNQ